MLEKFEEPVQILDIGGRPQYWEMMLAGLTIDKPLHVTLLNMEVHSVNHPDLSAVVGDGRALPQYADKQFDIVFSNSTIEHAGTSTDQKRMADEVRRIGKAYCVQTPNRYFPIEAHFLFPFFQFLPLAVRAWLVNHFSLGWYGVIRDKAEALREVSSIRLLDREDMRSLFPDATIHEEKYFGLAKSFVAYRGRSDPPS
jgi:ubiquinone/menaquinone biosynthesis C-methylase UbiE